MQTPAHTQGLAHDSLIVQDRCSRAAFCIEASNAALHWHNYSLEVETKQSHHREHKINVQPSFFVSAAHYMGRPSRMSVAQLLERIQGERIFFQMRHIFQMRLDMENECAKVILF